MRKQSAHHRNYKSGRTVFVNPHIQKAKEKVSFFANKVIPDRWFIERDRHKKQSVWHVKSKKDRKLTYFQLVEFQAYPSSPYGDADHDGVPNIFDKQPLSAQIRKQVPPTVKRGNMKLTDIIGIFSLPRGYTCPGATLLCKRYCYAEPPERFRAAVVYSRNKNYAWTKRADFVKVLSAMIKSMKLPWFRIHEAGDFYSQSYLEKWIQVAKNNPQTKFLAFTKNWKLDFSNAPKNLTIRYSSDVSSKHIRRDLASCYVGVSKPKNFFDCRKRCQPGFCMACWNQNIDVYIPIHSVSKENVDVMFFKQFNPTIPAELAGRGRKSVSNLNFRGGKDGI